MPERSAVTERYRPARLTKMPRNRTDKKDLDVRIGSANLPVSQPLMLNTESAAFVVGEEEKDDDSAPHTVAKRQPCCRNRSMVPLWECAPVKRSALPARSQRVIGFDGQPYSNAIAEMRLKK